MGRLEGQRALVTGASSGVGAATARLLAREGAGVALLARGRDGLEAVAARVEQEGARAFVVPADVADREALEHAVEESVRELGGLDVVVVAAAASAFGRFDEIPVRDFDRCVAVTFGGAVDTIRAVLPHLERTGGRLVVIGSVVDTVALTMLSPYVAAKSALDGFLRTLRAELRASRSAVGLSVIRPGPIDTPFWQHLTHPAGVSPPRLPPLVSYTPESVARATVACAIDPRPSLTIGGATLLLQAAGAVARPLTERALSLAARLGRALGGPDDAPSSLWEPSGDGSVDDGLGGRPSVVTSARLGRSRP
jgi:NAD(P)-dependent dehydrogenase (short-subunit alcohol dehydrogenase family)